MKKEHDYKPDSGLASRLMNEWVDDEKMAED